MERERSFPDQKLQALIKRLTKDIPELKCPFGNKVTKLCNNPKCKSSLRCGIRQCKTCGKAVHLACGSISLQDMTEIINQKVEGCREFMLKMFEIQREFMDHLRKKQEQFIGQFGIGRFGIQNNKIIEQIYNMKDYKQISGHSVQNLCWKLQQDEKGIQQIQQNSLQQYKDALNQIVKEFQLSRKQCLSYPLISMQANTQECIEEETVSDPPPAKVSAIFEKLHFQHRYEDKIYIKSKKKWKDFQLHEDLIEALREYGMQTPTRVQLQTLEVTVNPDRKKINILIRSPNGSGKTMAFIIPILNSIQPGLSTAQDRQFKGKLSKNEIFKPQAIIIVQTNILQNQLTRILNIYQEYGQHKKSEKLNFKIGRMDKEAHEHGDIIVTMPKAFMNRTQRGNLKLDNCKFIAIDQVDDIFQQEKATLGEILKIAEDKRTSVIACSATMKKQFIQFYEEHVKDVIKFNVTEMVQKQLGDKKITLEGVKNYYKVAESKTEMHKFIIGTIFKELYEIKKANPQIFIFFDSIDEIRDFHEYFKKKASEFTSDQAEYLKPLKVGIIAGKKYEDGKKVEMSIKEKHEIMTKFRNNDTNILLATDIIARSIDVRNACFIINVGPPKLSEKDTDIDLDLYLHRLGRTGRNNDRGISLTLVEKHVLNRLLDGMKKTHKIEIKQMINPSKLADEIIECIAFNSQ